MNYSIIIKQDQHGFGATVPDLPGCAAVGSTAEEALGVIRQVIELHLQELRKKGMPVPQPRRLKNS